MLPKDLPNLPNLDIAVYMQTATEVGGDYYDFHVGMDGTLTVVIGDATGHGMKAGTMVTTTKSLFNILAPNPDILTTFSEISRVIKGMKFHQLSMCLMLVKIKADQLFVSSAAMPPALIYRKKNRAIEEIFMKGMPLGAMNNFPYTLKETHLETGDTILLLSDGLPELPNNNNEIFGYDRTKTEFHAVGNKEPEEIVDHLKNSASQWVADQEPDDDITFVVIKVK
jgi:serine phosphatase RsbU (regulator of sigma subunit)